jgi:hypothetical protein
VDQQRGQRDKGRIRVVLPMTDLFLVETVVVLRASMSESVVFWVISLHQDLARSIASSRAASHLGDKLKCPFRGTKIRQRETGIDRYDSDKSDVGEIVTLSQHLRAHQHVDFAFAEFQQHLLEVTAPRSSVTIDSAYAKSREDLRQHRFNLLGSLTDVVDVLSFA